MIDREGSDEDESSVGGCCAGLRRDEMELRRFDLALSGGVSGDRVPSAMEKLRFLVVSDGNDGSA